jgi:hypothetical protein
MSVTHVPEAGFIDESTKFDPWQIAGVNATPSFVSTAAWRH